MAIVSSFKAPGKTGVVYMWVYRKSKEFCQHRRATQYVHTSSRVVEKVLKMNSCLSPTNMGQLTLRLTALKPLAHRIHNGIAWALVLCSSRCSLFSKLRVKLASCGFIENRKNSSNLSCYEVCPHKLECCRKSIKH